MEDGAGVMNRSQRRNRKAPSTKKKYSLEDVQRSINVALQIRKLTKGHLFSKNLKDRCVFCGKTMKVRSWCPASLISFIDRIQTVLINPEFFKDNEMEVLWIKNDDEYGNIKVPLVGEIKSE
jgi:hypothetical protein